jgi:hypothetical protein
VSETLRVDRAEGEIAGPLGLVAEAHREVTIGSYPFIRDGRFGSNLVVRGEDGAAVAAAMAALREMVREMQAE